MAEGKKRCSVCGAEIQRGAAYNAHMRSHVKYGEAQERRIEQYGEKTKYVFYRT